MFIIFDSTDEIYFQSYLKLKYQVFVKEFGWSLNSDIENATVAKDQFDDKSLFCGMIYQKHLVGVCRCSIQSPMPYENMFVSYVLSLNAPSSSYSILTSFAFLKAFRGKKHNISGTGFSTNAHSLFRYLIEYLKTKGIGYILLSAGALQSEKAFIAWGFQPISAQIRLEGAPVTIRNFAYHIT